MKKNKGERGQSLVELAISITVIAMLLAGAAEFGIALFQYIQLRDAAQEGALYGSIYPADTTGIRNRVRYVSLTPIDLSSTSLVPDANIIITAKDSAGTTVSNTVVCPGGEITVEVKFNHTIFIPFATLFTGGSTTIPLSGKVADTVLNSSATCP